MLMEKNEIKVLIMDEGNKYQDKVLEFIHEHEDEEFGTIDWDIIKECIDADFVWVVIYKNEVAGLCTVGDADNIKSEYGNECENSSKILSNLFVSNSFRNKGIASHLVNYVLDNVENVSKGVYLTILDDGLADFYKRLGFEFIAIDNKLSDCSMSWRPKQVSK